MAHISTIHSLKKSRGESQTDETDAMSDSSDFDDQIKVGFGEDDCSDIDEDESGIPSGADPPSNITMMLPSLFAGRPPTVFLDYPQFMNRQREQGRGRIFELKNEKHKPLYFRSNHTIVCVSGAMKRSGFKRLVKGTGYNFFWGHHLKDSALQKLHPEQKVNHFPGSYTLGRKDYLWKNISRQQRAHPEAYDFVARTYVMPRDRELLEKDYVDGEVYIVKPPASAEGRGIRLVNRWESMPKPGQPAVVQRYLDDPLLIDGKKFDCRVYVAVTSFDPLRIYVYEEGLTRFCTSDYVYATGAPRSVIRNRYMHLTNFAVNKKNESFVWNQDADRDDEGSKWTLTALWRYLENKGVNVPKLRTQIEDILIKTLIAGEPTVLSRVNSAGRPSCFELFGYDIFIDAKLKPWLIEVNVACSLASSSPLDRRVKGSMMTDLLHIIGIVPYDKKVVKSEKTGEGLKRLLHGAREKIKHRNIFELRDTALKDLGEDDIELIATAEDENSRCGDWRRIFPCESMSKVYLPLFEFPRYRNTVMAKWMESPDWSLLGPLLSPDLPADHFARRLARAARPSVPRRETNAISPQKPPRAGSTLAELAASASASAGAGGVGGLFGGASSVAAIAAAAAARVAGAAPEGATDGATDEADEVEPELPVPPLSAVLTAGGSAMPGGPVAGVGVAACAQATPSSAPPSAALHRPMSHPLLSHAAGPPSTTSLCHGCTGGPCLPVSASGAMGASTPLHVSGITGAAITAAACGGVVGGVAGGVAGGAGGACGAAASSSSTGNGSSNGSSSCPHILARQSHPAPGMTPGIGGRREGFSATLSVGGGGGGGATSQVLSTPAMLLAQSLAANSVPLPAPLLQSLAAVGSGGSGGGNSTVSTPSPAAPASRGQSNSAGPQWTQGPGSTNGRTVSQLTNGRAVTTELSTPIVRPSNAPASATSGAGGSLLMPSKASSMPPSPQLSLRAAAGTGAAAARERALAALAAAGSPGRSGAPTSAVAGVQQLAVGGIAAVAGRGAAVTPPSPASVTADVLPVKGRAGVGGFAGGFQPAPSGGLSIRFPENP